MQIISHKGAWQVGGDYIINDNVSCIHPPIDLNYFERASNLIKKKIYSPIFFIFSDDQKWCVLNFGKLKINHFVELEWPDTFASDYLFLMNLLKHSIDSNSSSDWWGTWLTTHISKIVFAPNKCIIEVAVISDHISPSLSKP